MNLDLTAVSEITLVEPDGAICRYCRDGNAWMVKGTEPGGTEEDIDVLKDNQLIDLVAGWPEDLEISVNGEPRKVKVEHEEKPATTSHPTTSTPHTQPKTNQIDLLDAVRRVQLMWAAGKVISGQKSLSGRNGGHFLGVNRTGVTAKGKKIDVFFCSQNPKTNSRYARQVQDGHNKAEDIVWAVMQLRHEKNKWLARCIEGNATVCHPNYWARGVKIIIGSGGRRYDQCLRGVRRDPRFQSTRSRQTSSPLESPLVTL